MSLYSKVGGVVEEITSLPIKIDDELKEITELYSKKNGVIVTLYSSGALIEYMDYDEPIPVMAGWQYSMDGDTWTTVTTDNVLNTDGTFTGFIKTKGKLSLTDYTNSIPITEGSVYTLNGESGTADISEVLKFDEAVTGTIKYKEGDLLPGAQITVVDASGNVIEGATISFVEISDVLPYDFSGAYWVDVSTESNQQTFELYGVKVIDTNNVAKLVATGSTAGDTTYDYSIEISVDSPNNTYTTITDGANYPGEGIVYSVTLTAYDSSGNVLQTYDVPEDTPAVVENDWNLDNMTATYIYYSPDEIRAIQETTLAGITGSTPTCTKIGITYVNDGVSYSGFTKTISDNNPNVTFTIDVSNTGNSTADSIIITLYDADGNVLGEGTTKCVDADKVSDWDLSGAYIYEGAASSGGYGYESSICGITGTTPVCTKVIIENLLGEGGGGEYAAGDVISRTVSNNNPNTWLAAGDAYAWDTNDTCIITLYDADDNVIAKRTNMPVGSNDTTLTPMDWDTRELAIDFSNLADTYSFTVSGITGSYPEVTQIKLGVDGYTTYDVVNNNPNGEYGLRTYAGGNFAWDGIYMELLDANGNTVISGVIDEGGSTGADNVDWNFDNMTVEWIAISDVESVYEFTISGITGSTPEIAKVELDGIILGGTYGEVASYNITDNNPNISHELHTFSPESSTLKFNHRVVLYNANGDVVKRSATITCDRPYNEV